MKTLTKVPKEGDPKVIYDPRKSYTWSPDMKFELDGREFGLILNTLRAVLATEEANKIIMAQNAASIMEAFLRGGVENGTIKELVPNPEPEDAT